jgi:uncharacterized membrane protein
MWWIYSLLILCALIGAYGTKLVSYASIQGTVLVMVSGISVLLLWVYVAKNYKNLVSICANWDALYTLAYTGFLFLFIKPEMNINQLIGIILIIVGTWILNHG